MSSTGRNFGFAYALLVILPLIGLAGVLRNGRGLSAPAAIDGIWSFHFDPARNGSSCASFLAALPEKTFSISQSGTTFVLSASGDPKISGSGTLAGTKFKAAFASTEPADGGCRGHQSILVAELGREQGLDKLAGTLSTADCPSCAAVAFHAERAPVTPPAAAPNNGGH
jgi:hypothetical protein